MGSQPHIGAVDKPQCGRAGRASSIAQALRGDEAEIGWRAAHRGTAPSPPEGPRARRPGAVSHVRKSSGPIRSRSSAALKLSASVTMRARSRLASFDAIFAMPRWSSES
jgi:hypothetical protein